GSGQVPSVPAGPAAASIPGSLSARELRDFLLARLPSAMVPADYVVLAELPSTPQGKVDRRALPAPAARTAADAAEPLHGPLEELLAGIWEDLLGVERVGPRENFFELGGHSLLATQ